VARHHLQLGTQGLSPAELGERIYRLSTRGVQRAIEQLSELSRTHNTHLPLNTGGGGWHFCYDIFIVLYVAGYSTITAALLPPLLAAAVACYSAIDTADIAAAY
jgi:hypothetical protein